MTLQDRLQAARREIAENLAYMGASYYTDSKGGKHYPPILPFDDSFHQAAINLHEMMHPCRIYRTPDITPKCTCGYVPDGKCDDMYVDCEMKHLFP